MSVALTVCLWLGVMALLVGLASLAVAIAKDNMEAGIAALIFLVAVASPVLLAAIAFAVGVIALGP